MTKAAEVTVLQEQPSAQVVQADGASILAVISRAASDPNTDVDKLERLMGLYERITERNAKGAFTAALAEMQPQMPVIDENGAIRHDAKSPPKSTYAKYEDINEAVQPLLAKYGFSLTFRVQRTDNLVSITGVLSHREGHSTETTIDLPADASGSKNAVQAVGSSISYGKRYAAIALLNITSRAPGDRDDDAFVGGGMPDDQPKARQQRDTPGRPRMSSAEAKRQGIHDKFMEELRAIDNLDALELWERQVYPSRVATVPMSWVDPMANQVELHRNELIDKARDSFPGDRR
jgi:hypothetical protein